MNSADQLLRLYEYDSWANEQVLLSIQENIPFDNDDKCTQYFAHITGSQEVWYNRITGNRKEQTDTWPEYELPTALQKLNTLNANFNRLIDSNRQDLDKIIRYHNSKGTEYETMLSDILHHIIIHGQHHRAQIAKLLRDVKIEPPATDFIFFSRTN